MILVLTPDDLDGKFISHDIDDIEYHCFYTRSIRIFAEAHFAIYIQDKDNWKILKCRYLEDSKKTKEILKLLNINV